MPGDAPYRSEREGVFDEYEDDGPTIAVRCDTKESENPLLEQIRARLNRMSDAELVEFWRKLEAL